MRPIARARAIAQASFPRVSGDAPGARAVIYGEYQFSPRERGCALAEDADDAGDDVFPA